MSICNNSHVNLQVKFVNENEPFEEYVVHQGTCVLLLYFVEGLELGARNKNSIGFLSIVNIKLLGHQDLKRTKVGFQFGNSILKVDKGLGNVNLDRF